MSESAKKEFIESLQRELQSAAGTQIAKDYENALRLVAQVVFTRSSGFILEFIQNAEDAGLGLDAPGWLEIAVNDHRIKILHNGRPFTEQDVRAICGIQSSKRPEKGTLGYLGIGFKSVFKVTDSPQIHSNGFQFKFDKNAWPNKTPLWRVLPIWVDAPPEPIDPNLTTFIVPLRRGVHSALRQELRNLGTELYLFLRWLKKIRIHDEIEGASWELESLGEANGVTALRRDGSLQKFRFFRKTVKVPEDVQQDDLTQDYRANVLEREIAIAFALDKDDALEPTLAGAMYGGVYSFLPLGEASSGAKFPIQADFLVQPGRDAINYEAKWNRWLVEQVAELCKEALFAFKAHPSWKYQFLPVFAVETTAQSEAYQRLFGPCLLTPLKDFLQCEPLIPTESGGYARPDALVRLKESSQALHELLDLGVASAEELPAVFTGDAELQLVHSTVRDGGYGGINIETADRWDLLRNADLLRERAKRDDCGDWFCRLYQWLRRNPVYTEHKYRGRLIRDERRYHECEIVLTSDRQILQGGKTFLIDVPGSDPLISELATQIATTWPIVHPDVFRSVSSEAERQALRGFLTGYLGVQILDAKKVCLEALLPKIRTNSTTPGADDLVKWTRCCQRVLGANLPEKTEIWVLTKDQAILPARECLLPVEFAPEQDWETNRKYVPGTRFVSPDYIEAATPEVLQRWRLFFRRAGVKESPDNGIEVFAMSFAEEQLRQKFGKVTRVDKLNLGYDLKAEQGPNGETIHVEVKGRAADQDIELTSNESAAAHKHKDTFFLCVVAPIPTAPRLYMVQDPASKGKADKLTIPQTVWKAGTWP